MGVSNVLVLFGLCLGGILAFAAVVVVLGRLRAGEAMATLESWARTSGWTIERQPDTGWTRRVSGRDDDRVTFAVRGVVDGRAVAVAEYHYSKAYNGALGRRGQTYDRVLLVAQLRRPARTVAVSRRKSWQRSQHFMERDRPTSVGVEAFDLEYRVEAPDVRAVRMVIGEHLIAEHIAGRLPDWSVEGTEVLTYRDGRLGGDLSGIPTQFSAILRVAELIEADAGTATAA